MTTIERMIRDRDEANDEPLDHLVGAASDDVSNYVPLLSNAIAEVTAKALKSKETAAATAAAANTPAGLAQKAATDARQKANLAAADAITETDPNGPRHKAAADLALQASAAEAKAAVYGGSVPGADAKGSPGAHGAAGGPSFFAQHKTGLIVGGIGVAGVLGLIMLLKRKS